MMILKALDQEISAHFSLIPEGLYFLRLAVMNPKDTFQMFKSVCVIPISFHASQTLSQPLRHPHHLPESLSAIRHSDFSGGVALEATNRPIIGHESTACSQQVHCCCRLLSV